MWQIVVMLTLLSVYMFAQYHEKLRETPAYVWSAIVFSVCSNLLWVSVAKGLGQKDEIFRHGFYWDVATYAPIVLVPLLFFSVRPSALSLAGIGMVIGGAILFHLGGR